MKTYYKQRSRRQEGSFREYDKYLRTIQYTLS